MAISGDEINSLTKTGLNLIQQALSIFDSELNLAVCNQRYQDMFDLPDALVKPGVSFEETIRLLVNRGEYGPVDDPEDAVKKRVEAARAFVPHYMERRRSNGRWLSVEGFPLPEGGWVTVYTDITEVRVQQEMLRARSAELSEKLLSNSERLSEANRALSAANTALEAAKTQLTETEARTRLTTEMMPAHIAHIDRNLRYTYTNRRLSSIIPGRPSKIIGLTGREALGEVSFAKIKPSLQRALEGEPSVFEFTDEDSGRRIRAALTPDQHGEGPVNGVYILSTDVTEETQARATILQTHKRELAAQLTSGLAHDFSNLLTVILGLQTRLEKLDLPDEARDLIASTQKAARRGGSLLGSIAAMSGEREMQLRPVHLNAFLEDLSLLAGPTLPDHITLSIDASHVGTPLLLDAGSLQDSLLNLILNAKDAIGKKPGHVALNVQPIHETWIEFSVSDTGSGFSNDALNRALDPFFTTKGSEGSGLGLAMVYDQAKISGGALKLENTSEGGARVTLRLPYRAASMKEEPRIVLLVEDNDDLRENVRGMLRALGHSVIEAASAEEAEGLIGLPGLDLVLTDINLRGNRTGLDLAETLEATGCRNVALMTSLPVSSPLRKAASQRFPLLPKPFDAQTLADFLPTVSP